MRESPSYAVFFDASGTLFQLKRSRQGDFCYDLYPDVLPTIHRLHKSNHVNLGVVTNWGHSIFELLNDCGIASFFSVVVHAEMGFGRKPQESIFREACRQTLLPACKVLFVGDSLVDDAWGAHNAGLFSVWLQRPLETNRSGSEKPDQRSARLPFCTVQSLESLVTLPFFTNEPTHPIV